MVEAGDAVLGYQTLMLTATWRNLPPGLRAGVLGLAMGADTRGVLFERLVEEVAVERDPAIRADILRALAVDPRIDLREVAWLAGWFWGEPGRTQAEAFVRQHLHELLARYPDDFPNPHPSPFLDAFTSACSDARRTEIRGFLRAAFSALPGGARRVEEELAAMDGCIWRRTWLGPVLARWLDGRAAR